MATPASAVPDLAQLTDALDELEAPAQFHRETPRLIELEDQIVASHPDFNERMELLDAVMVGYELDQDPNHPALIRVREAYKEIREALLDADEALS